jgi:purine-binding chemotaxis protein CheW
MNEAARRELSERLAGLEQEMRTLRRALSDDGRELRPLDAHDLQVLCFSLRGDLYGVPVESVREVVRYVALTAVADVPSCVIGALNLRGQVLPVIDGRMRFGLPYQAPRLGTVILIVERRGLLTGVVADGIRDVLHIPRSCLNRPRGALASSTAIFALATLEPEIVQLVDVENLLDALTWSDVDRALRASCAPEGSAP